MHLAQNTPQARGKGRPTTRETAQASLGAILNLVRSGKATTRQELERESELGRAVVADRLATLIEIGLIDESELGAATGGRAPRLVRFEAELRLHPGRDAGPVGTGGRNGRSVRAAFHGAPRGGRPAAPAGGSDRCADHCAVRLVDRQASRMRHVLWGIVDFDARASRSAATRTSVS